MASPFPLRAAGEEPPANATPARKIFLSKVGGTQTLMADKFLGMRYYPDVCLTQLHGNKTWPFRALVTVGISTRLIEGKDLGDIAQSTEVLKPEAAGSFDSGYAGVSGAYYHSDGKLYVVYHAENQEDMPELPGFVPGFYCSVGLAVSNDNGATFTSLGPIITSQKPKSWTAFLGQTDRGAGAPSCTVSRDGRYLYAYYVDHSRVDHRGVQIFIARADLSAGPPLPGSWRKLYHGTFTEPGIAGLDTEVMSADSMENANAAFPFVDFSPYLKRYVMLFNIDVWREHDKAQPERSGIYAAYSEDGIRWTAPEQIIKDFSIALLGKSVSWHPSIIWDDAQKREGTLVFGYSPKAGHDSTGGTPHYVVGQRIKFSAE